MSQFGVILGLCRFKGLMTIGAEGDSMAFEKMRELK
jgi:hypothetical protein